MTELDRQKESPADRQSGKQAARTDLKLNLCWLDQPNLGDPRVPTNGLWYARADSTQINDDRQVYRCGTIKW